MQSNIVGQIFSILFNLLSSSMTFQKAHWPSYSVPPSLILICKRHRTEDKNILHAPRDVLLDANISKGIITYPTRTDTSTLIQRFHISCPRSSSSRY